jgi:hypothetical protein
VSHMVIFRTPEGKPGYQPAETVQDAVQVVERLRNEESVENVRIFRLEEVQFELRPYYKVELAGIGTSEDAPAESPAPAVFGASDSVDDAVEAVESDDEFDGAESDTVDHAETSHEVPPPPSAAHPPWAAPPPPPAPVEPPGVELGVDDELSGAGQRRGLFGR